MTRLLYILLYLTIVNNEVDSEKLSGPKVIPKGKLQKAKPLTYRAAVYEHKVIFPYPWAKNRHMAVMQMMANLKIYDQQAEIAGAKGVDIMVFPEDGIYGYLIKDRHVIKWYLEPVPDPKLVDWIPCDEPMRFPQGEVQVYLSCLAKRNKMYIVANMGDIQKCHAGVDPNCKPDGFYQYNTNVAYDRNGRFIAKYHKQNRFFEPQFNAPTNPEYSYFDTEFGRFGMMICNDILFYDPGLELIRNHGVTDIVFPTAWSDTLPYYSAIGYMMSFAVGHTVNFLGANIRFPHNKKVRFHGSGIFTPAGALQYVYDPYTPFGGHLLIADVPINKRKVDRIPCDVGPVKFGLPEKKLMMHPQFKSTVLKDWYDFVLVKGTSGAVTICQKGFCCTLQYEKERTYDIFAFGVFHGLHKSYGSMYQQICILTKCRTYAIQSCGLPALHSSTRFKSFRMTGNFTTPFIHPQIIVADKKLKLGLPAIGSFHYGVGGLQGKSVDRPLISATLIGRHYHKDCQTCIGG
ncbi:pantetheinase-like [Mya arenaria]|uniref:pantetheinase-like n=1 Tax=Mya arenaria TaxID=6604 RepID=UPI0022DF10AA|nr:pantetheinase-like [Mya arenaria]